MTEVDRNDGSENIINLNAFRAKKAKDRLEGLGLDPQIIKDVSDVAKSDFNLALQESMEEIGVPMSMRIKINLATQKKLSDQKPE